MIYAKNNYENKLKATPGEKAYCPICNGDVIAKCGEIKTWHWAHVSADCDPWSEGETDWHLSWKSKFTPEQTEVVIDNHRADIVIDKTVWEVQHSSISPETIREREQFYNAHGYKLEWIFDIRNNDNFNIEQKNGYANFEWGYAHNSLVGCENIHFDKGNMILSKQNQQLYKSVQSGWGYLNSTDDFIRIIMFKENIKDRIINEYCARCEYRYCAAFPVSTFCSSFKEKNPYQKVVVSVEPGDGQGKHFLEFCPTHCNCGYPCSDMIGDDFKVKHNAIRKC